MKSQQSMSAFAVLAAAGLMMMLSSCRFFSSQEITVSPVSAGNFRSYFRHDLINPDGLRFDSINFLRGNLLERDFIREPQKALHLLDTCYQVSRDPKFLVIAADLCHYLAVKRAPEKAVACHLSALYYCRKAAEHLSRKKPRDQAIDFVPFQLFQIYNEACCGIYYYLQQHDLLDHDAFQLQDMEKRKCSFLKPEYRLSVPRSRIIRFSMCPEYQVHSLMQINRQAGFGMPLVAHVKPEPRFRSLKTPEGLTIPVTMLLRCRLKDGGRNMELSLFYQDTSLKELLEEPMLPGAKNSPLALDFSTPLACMLNSLPERNLISVMLNSETEDKNSGLFLLEPYNPAKIPVVFVHGLMSSPGTWIQMINTLKTDPVIRRRYQFWFFYYSSGAPVLYSTAKLYRTLLEAQKELCTTREAEVQFNRMVLVGHSMGGLIARTMLMKNPYHPLEYHAGQPWTMLKDRFTPQDMKILQQYLIFRPLPFVHRVVFMAVPHRGSGMAHWHIAHFGSHIIKLPEKLLKHTPEINALIRKIGREQEYSAKLRNQFFTGIDNLAPDSPFIQSVSTAQLKDGLIYHSVIGNQKADDIPDGSDGVVPYTSSHLDGAASELIVRSGHSVHRTPRAMHELLRILHLHLDELK